MGSNCSCLKSKIDCEEIKTDTASQEQKETEQISLKTTKEAMENKNDDNRIELMMNLDEKLEFSAGSPDGLDREKLNPNRKPNEMWREINPDGTAIEESNLYRNSTKMIFDQSLFRDKFNKQIKEGYGVLTLPDGSVYKGNFSNYVPNGQGKYFSCCGSVYRGNFLNGIQDGNGTEVYPDGSSYEGVFCQGKRNGIGVFKWPSGKVYSGDFSNDLMHGWGKCTWPDGRKYEGLWLNGSMQDSADFPQFPNDRKLKREYSSGGKQSKDRLHQPNARNKKKKSEDRSQPGEEEDTSKCSRGKHSGEVCFWKKGKLVKMNTTEFREK